MTKIVCNRFVKRIVCIFMIIVILSSFIMPNIILATGMTDLTYEEALDILENGNLQNYDHNNAQSQLDAAKQQVVDAHADDASFDESLIRYDITSDAVSGGGQTHRVIAKYSGSSSGSDSDDDEEETYTSYLVSSTMQEVIDTTSGDLGGTLLRPFIAFINFFADSIMKYLGIFMYRDAYESTTGSETILVSSDPHLENLGYSTTNVPSINLGSGYTSVTGNIYPNFRYTPEEIFSGQVDLLSIDFISGKDSYGGTNSSEGWTAVRATIAGWYKVLRMIAIIGLLSVLIYTGIKIILSSSAKDKAKYKEWIINWLVAVALLFSMHYIMSFTITVTTAISNLFRQNFSLIKVTSGSTGTFYTNLMGLVRFRVQSTGWAEKVGFEVMYIALIAYTVKFTVIYLKRVMNMAFLTLVAPIVALTYPIDKINDGKAQGFEMWLKEYVFNALLQPLHLILYYILVSSAISIAASNPLYGIVALMFMSDAERLLKKIFGFDKAKEGGTVGGLASTFAAASIANTAIRTLGGGIGKVAKGALGGGDSSSSDGDYTPIRDTNPNQFLGSLNGNGDEDSGGSDSDDSNRQDSSGGGQDSGGGASEDDDSSDDSSQQQPSQMTKEQFKQRLMKMGYSEQDASKMADNNYNKYSKKDDNGNNNKPKNNEDEDTDKSDRRVNMNSIRNLASKNAVLRGAGAVGRKLIKPVWDTKHKGKYNGKRLVRNIVRGGLGVGAGIAVAAAQAGISIADGKYNPLEAVGAFSAGYAGMGRAVDSVSNTFMEGYLSGNNQAKMDNYLESWTSNEKTQNTFQDQFGDNYKEALDRGQEFVKRGYTDQKKVAKAIKTANALSEQYGLDKKVADKQVATALAFEKRLRDEGIYSDVMHFQSQRDEYIKEQVRQGVATRQQLETGFKILELMHK